MVVMPGISKSAPIPRSRAELVSASSGMPEESLAKVVLHERANAVDNGTLPSSKRSSFGTSLPPMTRVPGQSTRLSARTFPDWSAAAAVTILNVEPGG